MSMQFTDEELERLAHQFKLLGEPTRLRILSIVCDRERHVQDICQQTGLNQGNVSKHLRLLKDAGLVACRREGVQRFYRVTAPDLMGLCSHARQLLSASSRVSSMAVSLEDRPATGLDALVQVG